MWTAKPKSKEVGFSTANFHIPGGKETPGREAPGDSKWWGQCPGESKDEGRQGLELCDEGQDMAGLPGSWASGV